jgi:3-methyladenine DNA glycosylase AlkD
MENITDCVIKELRKNADEKTREISQRFFKEEIKSRGIRSATVQKISKEYFKKIETKR